MMHSNGWSLSRSKMTTFIYGIQLFILMKGTSAYYSDYSGHPHRREWMVNDFLRNMREQQQQGNVKWNVQWSFSDGWETTSSTTNGNVVESRVADPDEVLTFDELNGLEKKIKLFEDHETIYDRHETYPVQLVVAIVNKMNLLSFRHYQEDKREQMAAESFATVIHDTLGVGHRTSRGGTGIVIFFSLQDRVIYISRGAALQSILSKARINRAIKLVRPTLRQARYADAIGELMNHLSDFIRVGEPTSWETFWDVWVPILIPVGLFTSVIGLVTCCSRTQARERRNYAHVASQLSDLDRRRAQALQGQYQVTSCPICLEDFQSPEIGSDGRPIKLLRCGHAFDETCWQDWITTGRSTVSQCLICKADIGQNNQNRNETERRRRPDDTNFQQQQQSNQYHHQDNNTRTPGSTGGRHDDHYDSHYDSRFSARSMRQFNQERNFRLERLAYRFPRYVRPQHIQRWTQSTYDGPLSRDPSFLERDPNRRHRSSTGNRTGNRSGYNRSGGNRGSSRSGGSTRHSSFGGGTSSGGGGGRW